MKTSRKWIIFAALAGLLLCLIFIFGNSLLDSENSMSKSLVILQKLGFNLSDDAEVIFLYQCIIRKCAHFTEFFALGLLLMALFGNHLWSPAAAMAIAAAAAFADEGLQLLSDRGNSLQDVALDSAGAASAILLCFLSFLLVRLLKIWKQKRK